MSNIKNEFLNPNLRPLAIPKMSSVQVKKQVGYSLFSARVKMDREDNFRNCPFGFVYK